MTPFSMRDTKRSVKVVGRPDGIDSSIGESYKWEELVNI